MKRSQHIVRRIKTPDGTMLESRHPHDYVSHVDANGETYVLDNLGNGYFRMSVNKEPAIDVSVYEDD